ncbi:MAG: hypothetical protein ABFS35_23575 [Bacteroidota bacterium]
MELPVRCFETQVVSNSILEQLKEIKLNVNAAPEWMLPSMNKKYNELQKKLRWKKKNRETLAL